MSKQVINNCFYFNCHFNLVVIDTIFYYPCFMLICMHCLLLASSRQWSGGYNYSHTYNYTYSYSGDDTLCLFATLAQSAVFICVYVYICESPADLPTSDRATEWGLKMVQFKIKFNENIYKADGKIPTALEKSSIVHGLKLFFKFQLCCDPIFGLLTSN